MSLALGMKEVDRTLGLHRRACVACGGFDDRNSQATEFAVSQLVPSE